MHYIVVLYSGCGLKQDIDDVISPYQRLKLFLIQSALKGKTRTVKYWRLYHPQVNKILCIFGQILQSCGI